MNRGQAPRMGRKIRGVEKISMCFLRRHTHTHLHSKSVTAGGISVRGASLNFCQLNSFQMREFPAGPAPSRCPVCQQICLKLGTFAQSFSSHLPEGELLLIKPFHLRIFDSDWGVAGEGIMAKSCSSIFRDHSFKGRLSRGGGVGGGRCCFFNVRCSTVEGSW